ncbi:MAG TPA: replicative DNA helicase [Thermodesulfobacteriota bacterium]|nr:replicative DNA helicase [Thermodesulfobacteriota bacterium]
MSVADRERVPPQHLEAERAVLGGILRANEAINRVVEILGPDDFYLPAHRRIYGAMLDLSERGVPIDPITLAEALRLRDQLEEAGGPAALAALADETPTAAGIEAQARTVRAKAQLRRLIGAASAIIARGYDEAGDVDDFLDNAERSVFELTERRLRPSFFAARDLVREAFRVVEARAETGVTTTGVPTGFAELDEMTGGLQPGDLVVIAGRPSMGKTAFALNLAAHAALRARLGVAIFSLEMSREQLVIRLLCAEAKVDASRLRVGALSERDWRELTRAASRLSEAALYIDDTPGLSVLEMRAKARRLMAERPLSLLIVDYLQLMRGSGRGAERREQEISEISRGLKALAKELDLPVIALSQLNRSLELRDEKRPRLADLRESGAIEQDADLILFLYREAVYRSREWREANPDKVAEAEVIIGKQRNGPTGTVRLEFLDRFTLFQDRTPLAA